jgi:hypothetical protein
MLAEVLGAPLMVAILVVLLRMFLSSDLLSRAREQADRGVAGRMVGHAGMDGRDGRLVMAADNIIKRSDGAPKLSEA